MSNSSKWFKYLGFDFATMEIKITLDNLKEIVKHLSEIEEECQSDKCKLNLANLKKSLYAISKNYNVCLPCLVDEDFKELIDHYNDPEIVDLLNKYWLGEVNEQETLAKLTELCSKKDKTFFMKWLEKIAEKECPTCKVRR